MNIIKPLSTSMTEAQIENWVENQIDKLDKVFMKGTITDEEYSDTIKEIDKIANELYNYAN